MAGVHPAQRLQLGARRLELGQHPARPDDEDLAGVGQRHVAGGALHQRQPDLVLEPADLLRQRGLGDVLALGRAREVQLLGERDQVAQLAQFHNVRL